MKSFSFCRVLLLAATVIGALPAMTAPPARAAGNPSTITTVVGNSCSPATSLAIAVQPQGVLLDGQGGVYVADAVHSVVCHVDASGAVTLIAGNGSMGYLGDGVPAAGTELYTPTGLALDSAGDLYIADRWNQRVRKVSAATGLISTVAGTGAAGYSGDGGLASAAQLNFPTALHLEGSRLYIADSQNQRVRVLDLVSGVITTLAGSGVAGYGGDAGPAASAQLNLPTGVTRDPWGNTYIADANNNRVRQVSAGGVITTVAGTGAAGFAGDGGSAKTAQLRSPMAVSFAAAALYLSDSGNHRVRRVDLAGRITTVAGNGAKAFGGDGGAATAAALDYPMGIAVEAGGTLWLTDTNNNRVRRVDAAGVITTRVGNGTAGFSGDGGLATAAEAYEPMSVDIGPGGALYFADANSHAVRKVVQGIVTTIAGKGGVAGFSGDGGQATAARLSFPTGTAVDTSGNVFIADRTNNRVRKVVAKTGAIVTIAGNGAAGFSGDGGRATSAKLNQPSDVAVDGGDNVYISDSTNNRVRKVSKSGIITTIAGNGVAGFGGDGGAAKSASLFNPTGIVVDGASNIYVADRDNQRVRRFRANGTITTIAGNGVVGFSPDGTKAVSSALNFPAGIGLDRTGNLLIADTGNCIVRKVTAPGTASATIATTVGWNPVGGVQPVCGYAGDGGGPTTGGTRLYNPISVAVDGQDNVYIADSLTNTVRMVTP